eukprot:scaffold48938_cov34-Phaeocystis_antarctica.AAC.1
MRSRDSRPTTRTSPLRETADDSHGKRSHPENNDGTPTKTPELPEHGLGNLPERLKGENAPLLGENQTKPGSTRFKDRTAAFPKHPPGVEAVGNASSDEAGCTVEPVKPRRDAATEWITPVLRQR